MVIINTVVPGLGIEKFLKVGSLLDLKIWIWIILCCVMTCVFMVSWYQGIWLVGIDYVGFICFVFFFFRFWLVA